MTGVGGDLVDTRPFFHTTRLQTGHVTGSAPRGLL